MKIRCGKCDDVIESLFGHDFKYCKCGSVFVDGGGTCPRFGFEQGVYVYEVLVDGTERLAMPWDDE